MVSAYHSKKEPGVSEPPTFYMYRRAEKPFHLDYVFVPVEWQEGMEVEIGSHKGWASKSDHCPVTVTLSLPAIR